MEIEWKEVMGPESLFVEIKKVISKLMMEVLRTFDEKFHSIIKDNIKSVTLKNNDVQENVINAPSVNNESLKKDWTPDKPNFRACSYCRVDFDTLTEQREHYKLDWHRYNLKQSLLQKQPVTEEEFDEKATKDEVSSISGSDTEKEDTLDTYAVARGKIFIQNNEGKVFSLYACLLQDKKKELKEDALFARLHDCCIKNQKWAVLMLGGGHFAGAIFQRDEAILHKTFHCYTVRAGQGGSQSSRDSKSGTSNPKSAGASLRRYNEQSLVQHIKSIMEAWQTELKECSLIIYKAAGPYNRSVLFGGGTPLFEKSDDRLRTIPFSTKRATFTEVKRVHSLLTLVNIYSSMESAVEHFSKLEENTRRTKVKNTCIDRAKSREMVDRSIQLVQTSESSGDDEIGLSTENEQISFNDSLKEFEDTLTREQREIVKTKRKKKPKKTKAQKMKEQEKQRKDEIIQILSSGNIDKLNKLLENFLKTEENKNDFINEALDEQGNTLLHIAAINEQKDVLDFLLDNDANPCLKNQKQQTAYTCTQSKTVRDALKDFARENPDKFNYAKAQIPTNVLTPEELSAKKKIQRQVKKEKEKIKRKENEVKRKEESEKEQFLRLSDREKRALAAERRILSQSGTVISRCFLCASDIAGKVPFEYLGNRFCSVDCLKAHRMKNSTLLS